MAPGMVGKGEGEGGGNQQRLLKTTTVAAAVGVDR